MKISYDESPEFLKDLKKLIKKFPSLYEDLEITKKFRIELYHLKEIDSQGIFLIMGIGNDENVLFFKIKKFQCKCLKGKGCRSGIRIIYAYFPIEKRIVFLEIYYKPQQANENKERIIEFQKRNCN